MKKTIVTTLIMFSCFIVKAQWKQGKFVIGASSITPFANASSSGLTNLTTTNAEYQSDVIALKKIYDCHFNLLLDAMSNDLNRNWTMKSDWSNYQFPKASTTSYTLYNSNFVQFVGQNQQEAQNQRDYILHLAKKVSLDSNPLKLMVTDNALWHYPVQNPLQSPTLWLPTNPPSNWFPNNFLSDPYVLGIANGDEPDLVPTISAGYNKLKYFSNIFNDNYFISRNIPIRPLWTNLSDGPAGGDNPSFELEISRLKATNPKIVSVDCYPFMINRNNGNRYFKGHYFYILSTLRNNFLSNSNFWFYIHTSSTDGATPTTLSWHENTNYNQLMFSAFCPIAYGATGILYWPVDGSYYRNSVNVGTGIVNDQIKYLNVSKINKYVEGIVGPIVMNTKNIAAIHKNIYLPPADNLPGSRPWTSNIPFCGNNLSSPLVSAITDFPANEKLENYKGILKSVSADDILIGIFSNAQQNSCNYASADFLGGSNYYLWVVNKETYADNGVGVPTGTTQYNMTITLRGRHDGLLGSTRAMIYKGVDDYNNTLVSTPQNTLTPIYNAATNETTITIDVLNPGEGRMIKLFVANDIPIKPQAPTIIPPASGYTYQCTPATSTASVYTYNWYLDNVLTPIHTQTYTYVNDNCPHQLTCTVTYDDCYIESDKSQAELILGKKPLLCSSINPCTSIRRPCLSLAQARYAVAAHPTIANTLTIGIKQYTEDELAKRFFDASALAVEKVQTVSVYNKAGELALAVTDIGTEVANIDLSNLTEGVYTITVNGNNDYKEQQTFEYTVGKTPQQIQEELALDNTAIAGSDQEKAIEVLQEELYQKLKENVELLENSEALQAFFLNKEQGNFGIIEKINDALSHYDVPTAQKLINDWLPTTNLELNCLSYYNNFIKYLNGGAFSVNDISELYSLASLCPQKNGEVIYAARSLYNYLASDNDEFADACGNNLARNIVRVKGNNSRVKEAKSSTTIYPNPSKGSFYISFAQNTKGINTINILDIYGRSVLQQKAIGGTRNININQTLAKGIYTVQITNSATGKTETQKLIIQ